MDVVVSEHVPLATVLGYLGQRDMLRGRSRKIGLYGAHRIGAESARDNTTP